MDPITLRRLRLTLLEMLKIVDTICSENALEYYLYGGTLLGAVRHKGFIPWDDDLDIAMPRADYEKFLQICVNGRLGSEYFLQHTATYPDYWLPFAKIRKNNTLFIDPLIRDAKCHQGVYVDVFPLDTCRKDSGVAYHVRANMVKALNFALMCRAAYVDRRPFQRLLLSVLTAPFSMKTLSRFRDWLCVSGKNGDFFISYGSHYHYAKQTMPTATFTPCGKAAFEGEEFCVPNRSEWFLERVFGDWKKLPDESKRVNHNAVLVSFDAASKGCEDAARG